jgi:hypothetical protein
MVFGSKSVLSAVAKRANIKRSDAQKTKKNLVVASHEAAAVEEARGPETIVSDMPDDIVSDRPDGDLIYLDDWSFAFNGSRPLQLTGRVMKGGGLEVGDLLEYTSQLTSIEGRRATTKSGTVYHLGKPADSYMQLRKSLWLTSRSGTLGRDDGSSVPPLDEATPLAGIKLGAVVPCAPVRIPKVPGWTHQSGIALLHHWKPCRDHNDYIQCEGDVFNCPGTFDGQSDHMTSTVVDCGGRLLRTVEGGEYFLGRMAGASDEEWGAIAADALQPAEKAALGLMEDLLAV